MKVVKNDGQTVTAEIVRIDAKTAAKMLTFNRSYEVGVIGTNRKISQRTVARYAAAMLRGEWKVTHQGIAFLQDGSLDDGQHRLLAIIEADKIRPGIAVDIMVTSNLEHGIFQYIDVGLRRRLADVAASLGLKNNFQVAATARLFYCYMLVPYDGPNSWVSVDDFSGSLMTTVLEKYPSIPESVQRIRSGAKFPGNLTALSTGHALMSELRPDVDVEAIMRKLETGLGYTKSADDPIYRFREKLVVADRTGKNHDRIAQLAWFIKAVNREVAGRDMKQLGFTRIEAFPRIAREGDSGAAQDVEEATDRQAA